MSPFSKANRHLYARGANLRDKLNDQPDADAVNAFLDGLDDDDRLSLSYAQNRGGTSGLVDLPDDEDNVNKARFFLALRIGRGKKLNESIASDTEAASSLDEESRRDMDLASEWESAGGTDVSRRSSLPSILSGVSRTSSKSTGKTRRVSFSSETTGYGSSGPVDTPVTPVTTATPVTAATTRSTSTRQTRRTMSSTVSSATAKSRPPEKAESVLSLSRFACCK